jgi:uncharacterized protein YggU (UPF0235/DUF167 family)
VIFYRVFWKAMADPKAYPLPVNYRPVPPRRPTSGSGGDRVEGEADLHEDELEALFATPQADSDEDDEPVDEAQADYGVSTLPVFVIGPSEAEVVRGFDPDGSLRISVECSPDDGRANGVAIAVVARVLNLETHRVSIRSGHTKPRKHLRIAGMSQGELDAKRDMLLTAAVPETDDEADLLFRED